MISVVRPTHGVQTIDYNSLSLGATGTPVAILCPHRSPATPPSPPTHPTHTHHPPRPHPPQLCSVPPHLFLALRSASSLPLRPPPLRALCAAAGESLIEEAVQLALGSGWVAPNDHVVVLSRSAMDEFMVKASTSRACGAGPVPLLCLLAAPIGVPTWTRSWPRHPRCAHILRSSCQGRPAVLWCAACAARCSTHGPVLS